MEEDVKVKVMEMAPPEEDHFFTMDAVKIRMSADLKAAALTMTTDEARFLVDGYYMHQDNRKRETSQGKSMGEVEPHAVLDLLAQNSIRTENFLKSVLGVYVKSQRVGRWLLSVCGIGPVLSAGLLAHIDITRAPTVGHIWAYAGLDPKVKWHGKVKVVAAIKELELKATVTTEQIHEICKKLGYKPDNIIKSMKGYGDDEKFTRKNLQRALSRRPWNAALKKLRWLAGESFMKQSSKPKCIYGHIYVARRKLEIERNDSGAFAGQAKASLAEKNYGKNTEAYKWYSGQYPAGTCAEALALDSQKREAYLKSVKVKEGEGQPMLPPSRITLRAQRYAVKIFLSHLHHVMYEHHYKEPPPKPYILDQGEFEHAHFIAPENWPCE